jgi:hypothetical protein
MLTLEVATSHLPEAKLQILLSIKFCIGPYQFPKKELSRSGVKI